MPEGDLLLALLPAEVDLAAVTQRREVDQATVEVPEDDYPSLAPNEEVEYEDEEAPSDPDGNPRRESRRTSPMS